MGQLPIDWCVTAEVHSAEHCLKQLLIVNCLIGSNEYPGNDVTQSRLREAKPAPSSNPGTSRHYT